MGRILNFTALYLDTEGGRLPFMSLQMPLSVDLRPGAVMRVDENEELALKFLRCTNAGCDASIRLKPALLGQMRAGSLLRVALGWRAGVDGGSLAGWLQRRSFSFARISARQMHADAPSTRPSRNMDALRTSSSVILSDHRSMSVVRPSF